MSLFNNVNLDNQDEFIEIPDVISSNEEEETNKKSTETVVDEDTGMIEIPDTITSNKDNEEEELDLTEFSEETDGKETPPAKTKGSSSSSPFKPFVKALSEEGFLPSIEDDEFDKLVEELGSESEALMELSRRTIAADIEEYKKSAESDFKAFLEAREKGYDLNEWADVYEAKKSYSEITEDAIEDSEELQKNLIKQNLAYRGMSEDEIEDTIEAYETTGKLADNAKKAHKNLVKYAEAQEKKLEEDKKIQEQTRIKEREESLNSLKKEIDSIVEPFPGIKINKQTKDKIYANITTAVAKGANGEPLNAAMAKRAENPIKYAIYENLLLELGAFDGKLDKLLSKTKSKALSELEKTLSDGKNTSFKSGKNTLPEQDDDIDFRLPK